MKHILLLLISFLFAQQLMAQPPQLINYQAVVRNGSGAPLSGRSINVRFTIHTGTTGGTVQYQETSATTTDQFGLFNLEIGAGSVVSGSMTGITWSSGNKYLQVELDTTGGTTFVDMGTQQLVTVPYSFFAGKAATADFADSSRASHHADTAASVHCLAISTNIIVGCNSSATGDSAVIVGNNASSAAAHSSVNVGESSYGLLDPEYHDDYTYGGRPVLVGAYTYGAGVGIGYKDTAMRYESVAIGPKSVANCKPCIAIGDASKAFRHGVAGSEIVMGDVSYAGGYVNYFIGGGAGVDSGYDYVSCWACQGNTSASYTSNVATQSHQGFLGWYDNSPYSPDFGGGQGLYNDWWFGGPVRAVNPHDITFNITSRDTSVSIGTDLPGINFTVRGGGGTGAGNPGDITFQTSDKNPSSKTYQLSWSDKFKIRGSDGALVTNSTIGANKIVATGSDYSLAPVTIGGGLTYSTSTKTLNSNLTISNTSANNPLSYNASTGVLTFDTTITHSTAYDDTKFFHQTGTETATGAKSFINSATTMGSGLYIGNTTSLGFKLGYYNSSYYGIWMGGVTPGSTNYSIASSNDGSEFNLNAIGSSALVKLQINGAAKLAVSAAGNTLLGSITDDGTGRKLQVHGVIEGTDSAIVQHLQVRDLYIGGYEQMLKHDANGSVVAAIGGTDFEEPHTTLSGYGITDGVINTRTVNGHALSSNVTVTASDLGGITFGNATLTSGVGSVTVSNANVTSGSIIVCNYKSIAGTAGTLTYTLSSGSGFTITSSAGAGDSGSVISYYIKY